MKNPSIIPQRRGMQGYAMIYTLAALFFASLISVSIFAVSKRKAVYSGHVSHIPSAFVCANSALTAVETQIEQKSDDLMKTLLKFEDAPNYKWLLGTDTDANTPHTFTLAGTGDYSAEIIRFDRSKILLTVRGYGRGIGNSRAQVTSIYRLDGIQFQSQAAAKHAFFLAGEGRNFDQPIEVHGNAYFGGDVHFNGGAGGSIFHGTFKAASSLNQSSFDARVTFKDNAYFENRVKTNESGDLTFETEAGFQDVYVDKQIECEGNAYFNGAITGNKFVDMNGNTINHSGSVDMAKVKHQSGEINWGGPIDIADKLGLTSGMESEVAMDLSGIPATKKHSFSTLHLINFNGTDLNAKYLDKQASGELWNDYLVINVDADVNVSGGGDNVFDHKVIWLVNNNNTMNINHSLYSHTDDAMSIFYIESGTINDFGGEGKFRGYVHATGGNIIYHWGSNTDFQGAIHHTDPSVGFQMQGNKLNITYNTEVMNEIASLGLIPAAPGAGATDEYVITGAGGSITPVMLARYY